MPNWRLETTCATTDDPAALERMEELKRETSYEAVVRAVGVQARRGA